MRINKIYFYICLFCVTIFNSCTIATRIFKPKPKDAVSIDQPISITVIEPNLITMPAAPIDNSKNSVLLDSLLRKYPQYFDAIINDKKELNVQIIYTQINRSPNKIPALKNYYFNVNPENYFYPASTIKFPASILALQRLNELKEKGIDKNTTMLTGQAYSGQTAVLNDPTTPDGKPSIAHYIKKILMVSDNDAFNRLYEFLGPQYINEQLHKKGYPTAELVHRLQIALSQDENRHTNPIKFIGTNNEVIFEQPMQFYDVPYPIRHDSLGKEYYSGGNVVEKPMDFSTKNRLVLEDLHNILISIVFPEKIPAAQRFNITEDDRIFLLKYMSQLPTESTFPPYSADTANYYPSYCKFLFTGSEKGEWPKNIRSFNKVGDAYGQLLDVAYIVDFDKKVEFFLSAVIYCNSDGILNDDRYDYDKIGFPFMKQLGQVIYDYEVNREKKILPDLSALIFEYDKK
jgi:hypothetical protein